MQGESAEEGMNQEVLPLLKARSILGVVVWHLWSAQELMLDVGWVSLGAKSWGGLVRLGMDTPGLGVSAGAGRRRTVFSPLVLTFWERERCQG